MTTRAKFSVQSKTESKDGYKVSLAAVTAGSEDNAAFFKYTPSGIIDMGLIQKETADQFVPGKEYYVDFTAAE